MANIRKAALADAVELHKLGANVPEFLVNEDTVNFWPRDILDDALESDDVLVLVAEEQGQMLGFIIASYVSGLKKATIENVFVTPAYRSQGIGESLLDTLLKTLAERGCEYVATLVPHDAAGAYRLYQNVGFAKGGTFLWLDKALSDNFKSPGGRNV
jgi:ribosomal protein S18 acetylase RimI-like enzyme